MSVSANSYRLNSAFLTTLNGDITVDLSSSILMIDYYEDILSPVITANIILLSSTSLVNAFPIRGGEKVDLDISTAFGDLKLTGDKCLYVHRVTGIGEDSSSERFILELVSREMITNETTRCVKRYDGPIHENVKKILKEVLLTDNYLESNIEPTINNYSFIGNLKKPFNILTWLCPKSLPIRNSRKTQEIDKQGITKGVAGFLFYQTQEGFNFKSVESLVSRTNLGTDDVKKYPTYIYTQVIESNKVANEFKILNFIMEKNSDLISQLSVGMFSNLTYFYNLYTNKFSTYQYNLKDEIKDASKLGTEDNISVDDKLSQSFSRIYFRTSDVGVMDYEFDSQKINEGQQRDIADMAKSISRYNLLFTQVLNMVVPCNINLKAGDIINALFPRVEPSKEKRIEEKQSGTYLIKEVCHHFETGKVVSSLKLIRDSYGLYGPNNNS